MCLLVSRFVKVARLEGFSVEYRGVEVRRFVRRLFGAVCRVVRKGIRIFLVNRCKLVG